MESSLPNVFFPHDTMRESQRELVHDILGAVSERKHIIAHAPTGLGKTAAALAPALAIAEKENLTVLFLTSRHTQHRLAIDTAKTIKQRFGLGFSGVSMIGKRWMCAQSGIEGLSSSEFSDYCSLLRSDKQCEFYLNTRPAEAPLSVEGEALLDTISPSTPLPTEAFVQAAREKHLCPYEIGLSMSSKSRIIITDYYYAFHPTISENFLAKIGKPMEYIILVIDEGHNLPGRMRELLSSSLTTQTISFAKKEAERFGFADANGILCELETMLWSLLPDDKEERLISKSEVLDRAERIKPCAHIIAELEDASKDVQAVQKRSALGSIAAFLDEWNGPDEGFVRFCRKTKSRRGQDIAGIYYNCLDPSMATADIIDRSFATIIMSGTLTPTSMYSDLLGFSRQRTIQKEYSSPFDEANRLALIVPKTTTRFSRRSEAQFMRIADECARICDAIPGNVAVFFPSYFLRDAVQTHFSPACRKTQFSEDPSMSKQDRDELLLRFKGYKTTGAVLLAVASGSFGEGIDLPGDFLQGVVIVGLPLSKPDLEIDALIKYYDRKFARGWEYGYVLPAMTRTIQNAGRCIRTETDRGVIVFLDERYVHPQYNSCFPRSWKLKTTMDYEGEIGRFCHKPV